MAGAQVSERPVDVSRRVELRGAQWGAVNDRRRLCPGDCGRRLGDGQRAGGVGHRVVGKLAAGITERRGDRIGADLAGRRSRRAVAGGDGVAVDHSGQRTGQNGYGRAKDRGLVGNGDYQWGRGDVDGHARRSRVVVVGPGDVDGQGLIGAGFEHYSGHGGIGHSPGWRRAAHAHRGVELARAQGRAVYDRRRGRPGDRLVGLGDGQRAGGVGHRVVGELAIGIVERRCDRIGPDVAGRRSRRAVVGGDRVAVDHSNQRTGQSGYGRAVDRGLVGRGDHQRGRGDRQRLAGVGDPGKVAVGRIGVCDGIRRIGHSQACGTEGGREVAAGVDRGRLGRRRRP